MNFVKEQGRKVINAFDTLMNYKDLRSDQNPEVRRFIENYHALAFELTQYHNTLSFQTPEPELCKTIVDRIDSMNAMLLSYQSEDDQMLFNDVMVLRNAYRMTELLETRNEIQRKIDAGIQASVHADAHSMYQTPNMFASASSMPMPPYGMVNVDMTSHLT